MKNRSIALNSSLAKRTEEARRAQIRADNVLNKQLYEAGGLEDMRRMQFDNIKREQITLRQQLESIKRKKRLQGTSNGDSLDSDEIEDEAMSDGPDINSDYGKNYFGYKSSPGANKIMKNRRGVQNTYSAPGQSRAEREMRKKLREEKNKFQQIQNKTKFFRTTEEWESKKSNGTNLRHPSSSLSEINVEEAKEAVQNRLASAKEEKKAEHVDISHKRPVVRRRSIVIPSSQFPSFTELPKTLFTTDAFVLDADQKSFRSKMASSSSLFSSTATAKSRSNAKAKTALELVFDDEIYAPDGRIRMMHRLPDFNTSFREAKMARYTRTKYKRDIETELSVDEIFANIKQPQKEHSFALST